MRPLTASVEATPLREVAASVGKIPDGIGAGVRRRRVRGLCSIVLGSIGRGVGADHHGGRLADLRALALCRGVTIEFSCALKRRRVDPISVVDLSMNLIHGLTC